MISTIFLLAAVLALLQVSSGWVKPGDPMQLSCEGDFKGYKWIGPTGKEVKADDRHILDNSAGTLNITVVGEDDVGEFICENVEDSNEKSKHTIETSPYVQRMSKSYNHVMDETATIDCTAWGTGPLSVKWSRYKNGVKDKDLSNDTERVMILDIEDGRVNHVKQQLKLFNLTDDDYAQYECAVTNLHSNASSTTTVRVKDKLAPLWPFIGICAEILILIIIIVIYEKRKSKRSEDEDAKEKADLQSNANDHKGENVRFRK